MAQGAFLFGEQMSLRAYSLKGIREAIFDQLDWSPTQAPIAKTRVNGFIDRAVAQIALEAPALFHEDEIRMPVQANIEPASTTDLLKSLSTDAWVLQTELAASASNITSDALLQQWAGRYLLLKEPSSDPEVWHMIRVREVWSYNDSGTTRYRISLEKPWADVGDTGIEWRLVQDEFLLPDDLIEVRNISLMEQQTGYPYPLAIIGQSQAERATFPHQPQLQAEGIPRAAYRRERVAIDGPKRTPGVAVISNSTWAGPEAMGTFEYLITYVWGKHDEWYTGGGPENMDSAYPADVARVEPYLESHPSPVSDQVVIDAATEKVRVYLPDVSHMYGFADAGSDRYTKVGIKTRIYRRRVAADIPSGSAYQEQDAMDRFYLLDEVDGSVTTYDDDGSVIPDMTRPFREVHSYQSFRLYPSPDNRYELSIRCIRRPLPLQDDNDFPRITRDAVEAIILRASAYLYENQGDAKMMRVKLQEYEKTMHVLAKRYGDMRPAGRVRRRRVARVRNRSIWRREVGGVVNDA